MLPLGEVEFGGTMHPLYHLFHPFEHGRIWIEAPATDGRDGTAINLIPNVAGGTTNVGIECASCHNAHNNSLGNFLRKSNAGSAICTSCHIK